MCIPLCKLCAFPVRICIPIEDVHSWWGASPFPVRICIPNENVHSRWGVLIPGQDVHSRWVTSPFPVRHVLYVLRVNHNRIHILTGNGDVTHREWRCASPGMHILTGNGDVTHWECTSSPGMGMWLTENGVCLTRNGNVIHRECTSSPGMHILTGNAHSLYRVMLTVTPSYIEHSRETEIGSI